MTSKVVSNLIEELLEDEVKGEEKKVEEKKEEVKVDMKVELKEEKKEELKEEKKEEKKTRKVSEEEKKYIMDLYKSHFKLDEKELPTKKDDEKKSDLIKRITKALQDKHKILTLFNSNKILVMSTNILRDHYDFGKKKKKEPTAEDIIEKIKKLSNQLKKINDKNDVDGLEL